MKEINKKIFLNFILITLLWLLSSSYILLNPHNLIVSTVFITLVLGISIVLVFFSLKTIKNEFNKLEQKINLLNSNINNLSDEIQNIENNIISGNLLVSINTNKYEGNLNKILSSISNIVNKFNHYLDVVPSPILIIDKEFNIKYVNNACAMLLGTAREKILGTKCFNQLHTKDCKTNNCACFMTMQTGQKISKETVINLANKEELEIFYDSIPLMDNSYNVIGSIKLINQQPHLLKQLKLEQIKVNYYQNQLNILSENIKKLADGDLEVICTNFKKNTDCNLIPINNTFKEVYKNLEFCINKYKQLLSDIKTINQKFTEGELNEYLPLLNYSGIFYNLAKEINNLLHTFKYPLIYVNSFVSQLSSGNIPVKLDIPYSSNIIDNLQNNINTLINTMELFQNEVSSVIKEQKEGNLNSRINLSNLSGVYFKISEHINELIDILEEKVNILNRAIECIDKLTQFDFTVRFEDNDILNQKLIDMHETFIQIITNCQKVTSCLKVIASTNKLLSECTLEHSTFSEEISLFIEEMLEFFKTSKVNSKYFIDFIVRINYQFKVIEKILWQNIFNMEKNSAIIAEMAEHINKLHNIFSQFNLNGCKLTPETILIDSLEENILAGQFIIDNCNFTKEFPKEVEH